MPFIIDGHNLLWSVQQADTHAEPLTDIQLCRLIACYLRVVGDSAQVVFDGPGPRDKADFDNIAGVEVIFAGPAADADTVIENKLRADSASRRLTVVSSDRRLRAAARARKAAAVKSDVFLDTVSRALTHSTKSRKEPVQKRQGLTSAETDQWLDFFGLGR